MGRPFSQHDDVEVGGAFCDVWETAPGLSAPEGAPVADPPPGLSDGGFAPDIGDWALAVVVCPPPTRSCK